MSRKPAVQPRIRADASNQGPLIHPRAVSKCEEHVADAVSRGAKVLTTSLPSKRNAFGYYFNPVVLGNAPNDCVGALRMCSSDVQLITDEETFGPVACLIKFKTEPEVIVSRVVSMPALAHLVPGAGQRHRLRFGRLLLLQGLEPHLPSRGRTPDRNGGRQYWRHFSASHVSAVHKGLGVLTGRPFGGVKESGFGKEGGSEAILDFCNIKTVIVGQTM